MDDDIKGESLSCKFRLVYNNTAVDKGKSKVKCEKLDKPIKINDYKIGDPNLGFNFLLSFTVKKSGKTTLREATMELFPWGLTTTTTTTEETTITASQGKYIHHTIETFLITKKIVRSLSFC